ncbi:MAG: hypothetical protein PHY59_03905 [Methanobacterium sp.]|nr:hypothetical protein [Methanobacterium sp.]
MKYFKKLSTLLTVLMVISIVSGASAIYTADNSKTIYVTTNGNDANDGLTSVTPKLFKMP